MVPCFLCFFYSFLCLSLFSLLLVSLFSVFVVSTDVTDIISIILIIVMMILMHICSGWQFEASFFFIRGTHGAKYSYRTDVHTDVFPRRVRIALFVCDSGLRNTLSTICMTVIFMLFVPEHTYSLIES